MKVEVEPMASHSGNFAREDLEDENEELVQIQRERKAVDSNSDSDGDYDRIFIQ